MSYADTEALVDHTSLRLPGLSAICTIQQPQLQQQQQQRSLSVVVGRIKFTHSHDLH